MKGFALMVLVVLALAAPALAGVGTLGVFADNQGNSCNITDAGGGGLVTTYIVHKMGPGDEASGVRFRVDPPAGATWNYAAFTTAFTGVGAANTDISVGYGGCQPATILTGSVLWISIVAGPACTFVQIKEGFTGTVLATDCLFAEIVMPKPGEAIVNPNGGCQCNIAVQPSTWGQVKALYR